MNNKKIKLVLIHPSAFTIRWSQYYHLDELADQFDVEWWNISAIAAPHYDIPSIDRPYVRSFSTKRDFLKSLRSLPKDTLIDFDRVMFCRENYLLFRSMAKFFPNVIWFNFFWGDAILQAKFGNLIPLKQEGQNVNRPIIKKNIFRRIKTAIRKTLCKSLLMQYWIESLRDKNETTKQSQNKWFKLCWDLFNTRIISNERDSAYPINGQDYEQYLSLGDVQPSYEKYIVYVDQNFPFHPETSRQYPNIDIHKLAVEFQASMRTFFDRVEQQTGCKVIIALHPSSKYTPETFGNRPYILGKTATLVRDCEAAIMHCSNAINFAVFWNKQMLLCTNDSFRQCSIESNLLNTLVSYFKMPSADIDVEDQITFKKLPDINRQEYMSFFTNDKIKGKKNVDLYKEYLVRIHDEIIIDPK